MKIALTITELYPGGAEKCFVHLACFLKQQGHEVAVWQLWPVTPTDKRLLTNRLDEESIPWRSGGAVKIWDFPFTARWLRRELRDYRPDVVQSFLFHANVASAYAKPRGVPFFGGARVRQPEKVRRMGQRWAASKMDRLVCVSESVAHHCEYVEGIDNTRLLVIPNGISIPTAPGTGATWTTLGLSADAQVLLFVGRLNEQKGVLPMIQEAHAFMDRLPRHHLVLMGDGVQRQLVETAINASKFADRMHVVGWQADAIDWMRRAELLLLPAQYEGMPNVILEAMSVETAAVAFDVDGVRELLGSTDDADRQIATAGDHADFASKVIALAQSADHRNRCGTSNLQRVRQQFDLATQLARYEQLYLRSTQ